MATDNMVLEHLRAIRGTVENTAVEFGHVRHRVSALERQMAEMQAGIAAVHMRLDHHGDRLARIEHRLEITNSTSQQ